MCICDYSYNRVTQRSPNSVARSQVPENTRNFSHLRNPTGKCKLHGNACHLACSAYIYEFAFPHPLITRSAGLTHSSQAIGTSLCRNKDQTETVKGTRRASCPRGVHRINPRVSAVGVFQKAQLAVDRCNFPLPPHLPLPATLPFYLHSRVGRRASQKRDPEGASES